MGNERFTTYTTRMIEVKDPVYWSVQEVYGHDWFANNQKSLNRRFEWQFRSAKKGDIVVYLPIGALRGINLSHQLRMDMGDNKPFIVITKEKPTINSCYSTVSNPGISLIELPSGYGWIREWRVPLNGELYLRPGSLEVFVGDGSHCGGSYRIIVRKKQPKWYFKAEQYPRTVKTGDWYWDQGSNRWVLAAVSHSKKAMERICATRHEEEDPAQQVVTQDMIDALTV